MNSNDSIIAFSLEQGKNFRLELQVFKKNEYQSHRSIFKLMDDGLPMVAQKETYWVNDRSYQVYRFTLYNCYHPLCGSMHGHTRMEIGFGLISEEFGLLLLSNDAETKVLHSIREVRVAEPLIEAILRKDSGMAEVRKVWKQAVLRK